MKILYITSEDSSYGGAQCLKELIEGMDCEVTLINPKKNDLIEWCNKKNVSSYSTNFGCNVFEYIGLYDFSKNIFKKIIKYYLLEKMAIKNIEKNINIRSFDLIHTNTSVIDIGAKLAKRNNIKHIWHLREFPRDDYISLIPSRYKKMNNNGQKFIAISKSVKNAWIRKGIDEIKIETIYDGVISEKFVINYDILSEEIVKIIFCGYIYPVKNQEQLINALGLMNESKRSRYRVDFYGGFDINSDYYKRLSHKINKFGIQKNVSFKGYSNHIEDFIHEYDVGINCSPQEGFGRSTVEFMMSGLLVLASNTGANPEIINDGVTGLLYNNMRDDDLVEKLDFIYNNKLLCKKIAEKGLQDSKMKYAIEKNINELIDHYKMVLNNE